jgi:hypothetical protein
MRIVFGRKCPHDRFGLLSHRERNADSGQKNRCCYYTLPPHFFPPIGLYQMEKTPETEKRCMGGGLEKKLANG